MKIVFMGTPDFAQKSLKSIYEAGHEIIAVVTNPDRQKGRGMKFVYSPVKEYSIEKNLNIFQPERIRKNEEFIDTLKNMSPDLICVVAYGKILPKEILNIPKFGCINVHASLLPKYRGAAPIQWAVINGEEKTGITTMFMDEGMDTGDMILTEETSIGENETTGSLWDRLADIGGKLLVQTIEKIEKGTVKRIKQPDDFSLAPMLDKNMAQIDWNEKNANQIKNLVRGLNPIMGAYTIYKNKKLKFWTVNVQDNMIDDQIKPGTIIKANEKEGLFIKANDGIIEVIEIQAENSKKMNIKDYLRGNKLEEGYVMGK